MIKVHGQIIAKTQIKIYNNDTGWRINFRNSISAKEKPIISDYQSALQFLEGQIRKILSRNIE